MYVAADLLSQAEHDTLASAVLLTTSMELAQAVDKEIIRQTGYLSRSEIMEAGPCGTSAAPLSVAPWTGCAALANEIAPEHLEIVTEDPRALLPAIHNAGAVFLGALVPGAAGGLPGRTGPRAAHQRHRPVFLAPDAWTASSRP